MALVGTPNGNTVYIAGQGTDTALSRKNTLVTGIILTAGATKEILTLSDVTTQETKAVIRAAVDTTVSITDVKILFPNGIRADLDQTDSHVTLIVES